MRISIGCDDAGYPLKKELVKFLEQFDNIDIVDFGIDMDNDTTFYPLVAEKVALTISNNECDRGILICGTGLGMSMVANKIPNVRAALCHDVYSARRAVLSNNAQIITMGSRVIGVELAKTIIEEWLSVIYEISPSEPKIQEMINIDTKYRKTI